MFLDDVVLVETAGGRAVPALDGPGLFVPANWLLLVAAWMIRRQRVA